MADREKVIKGLETIRYNLRQMNHGLLADFCDDALELLKEQEAKIEQLNRFVNGFSRDAMHVVRCKDCKHWWYGNYCDKHGKGQENADWFCADGERQEGR